ncbi:ABC transporter substrate-binding protein [Streptomyces sp. NPDC053542]|uniref:ABC transporter substrate-binding protein n=1 Tax=Streptomyces sp. NPDC053542 TaxID=3365710 RepID=UPI0037D66780
MAHHSVRRPLRTAVAAAACLATLAAASGCSSAGGSDAVRIGVGGQPLLVYLPTTLAQQLGYYKKEGVQVRLADLQGGSKALQAMQGGSVDVVSGYYDHTIQMQAKHKDVVSFVNMLRYPSLVLAVSPKASKKIDSVEDLKGAKVGVTAPGSSTDFFLKKLLADHGMKADAASVQGIGGDSTAVAAMEQGRVDAAVMLDPAVSQLQKRAGAKRVKILTDTRNERGVKEDFGVSTYPAAVLYSDREWLDDHPDQARKLAKAIVRALKYIDTHSAKEIAAKMPRKYAGDDPAVYEQAIDQAKDAYAKDGLIRPDGAAAVHKVLAAFTPEIAKAEVDVKKTYTNEYLK